MKRSEAMEIILKSLADNDLALFTTGLISRVACSIKDRLSNFYMIGSMGLVSSVGLGIALHTDKRVFIFDGDGSVLMDMGTMAMIGSLKPSNLIHIVFDNESYQSTGGQPTISRSALLEKVAQDVGYNNYVKVAKASFLVAALGNLAGRKGPHFILIKVLDDERDVPPRVSLPPDEIAQRIKSFINKGEE